MPFRQLTSRRPVAMLLLLCACGQRAELGSQSDEPANSEHAWITTDSAGAEVIARAVQVDEQLSLSVGDAAGDGSELVLLRLPRGSLPELSHAMHDELKRCGGFVLRDSREQARANRKANTRAHELAYALDSAAIVEALLPELSTRNLEQTIRDLSAFPDRFHESETGAEASEWIRASWQSYAQDRPDVKVELIEHRRTPQPSVALTIPGASLPDEQVILGGHLDSINLRGGLAPGADDNASGIAVLSEVIRVALALGYRPERTVVFYGYAAEEVGLVGSGEIARAARERDAKVSGVLQLDMTNVNPAPQPYLGIVTDYATPALSDLAKQLIDEYVGLPWKTTTCGYACSDHASWFEHDFPVHHVHETTVEESNELLHTEQDTLELTDGRADHSLHFARYAAAFMVELAKGALPECGALRPCADAGVCRDGACFAPEPITGGAGAAQGGAGGATAAQGGAGTAAGGPSSPGGATTAVVGGMAGAMSAGTSGAPTAGAVSIEARAAAPAAAGCSCRTPSVRRDAASTGMAGSLMLLLAFLRRSGAPRARSSWTHRLDARSSAARDFVPHT
jgi:leucyl aminopeptidase